MKSAQALLVMLIPFGVVACDGRAVATDTPPTTAPAAAAAAPAPAPARVATTNPYQNVERADKITRSDQEWKKQLTPEQFYILREKGTERAFTGATWDNKEPGVYRCAGCDLELFSSQTKYESGSGWPSFWQPIAEDRVHVGTDTSHGMVRDEVVCARCGGHLGHVFTDGPEPTGLRYCMNSAAMRFERRDD